PRGWWRARSAWSPDSSGPDGKWWARRPRDCECLCVNTGRSPGERTNRKVAMLHLDRRDRVAVLTLDDPDRRNALSPALVDESVATLGALDADGTVGAIVVTGAGPAFCSGADLGDLVALTDPDGGDPTEVRRIYQGFLAFRDSALPTVAAVNGPAV